MKRKDQIGQVKLGGSDQVQRQLCSAWELDSTSFAWDNRWGMPLEAAAVGAFAGDDVMRGWVKREVAMLGVKPDEEVVRLTGHPIKAVIAKPLIFGLPKPNPSKNFWTPEENKLLGVLPDSEVAKLVGRSYMAVFNHRHYLRMPNRVPAPRVWTQAQLALLGAKGDRELSELFGYPVHVVTLKRRSLNIHRCRPRRLKWSAAGKARISAAQKARWAKFRRERKK